MSEEISIVPMKELKLGRYILIDDVPCKVMEINVSSPGKHGAAKMRIVAIGIFDSQKKTLLKPSESDVHVPIITKSKSQVVSISNNTAQLMDLITYSVYEIQIPAELLKKIKPGNDVEIIETMNKKIISRIVGESK